MKRNTSFRVFAGIILCLVLSFLAVPTASGAPVSSPNSALRRYPYLTDVTSTYATLNWATNRSKAGGGVRYGNVGSESCTANYVAATKTAITVNGVAQYQWKAQLDLQAGTPYCYRVYLGTTSTGEIDLLGTDASPSFQSQVSGGSTSSFSFVVLGDWGQVNSSGKNPSQAKLMSLIASSGALFVVTTGDNGYPSGNQTNYGDLVQTGSNISAIFGPSFWKVPGSSIPIFPVLGNHGLSSSDTNHPALVTWPQTRTVSGSGGRSKKETYCCLDGTTSKSYPSLWYAFDAGPARFYMLQAAWSEANIGSASNAYEVDYDYHWAPTTAQYKWLKADLTAHPSGMKFVFLHYPIHSDSSTQPSDTFLQGSNGIEGLFKQNGVDIVFTGHAHIYQRNRAGTAGVISYVTGGGGATLGSLGTCTSVDAYAIGFTTKGKACGSAPVPTSADQVYHFLKVTVNGSSVTVTPINALGKSFDVINYNFTTSAQALAPADIAPETVVPSTSSATPSQTLAPTSSPTATATVTCSPTSTPPPLATERATTPQKPTSKRSPTVTPVPTNSPVVTATPTCTPTLASPPATETPTATPSPAALSPAAPLPPIVGPGGALTFISEADAQVAESSPRTNFGTSAELQGNGDAGNTQISFIRFNVSDSHDTIQSVKLRLFSTTDSTNGPAVYLADNNWVEAGKGSVTWSNQPELLSSEVDNKGAMGAGTWVEYDVSSMVDGDGTYTFALLADGTNNAIFSSREGSMPPQLVMTFSP